MSIFHIPLPCTMLGRSQTRKSKEDLENEIRGSLEKLPQPHDLFESFQNEMQDNYDEKLSTLNACFDNIDWEKFKQDVDAYVNALFHKDGSTLEKCTEKLNEARNTKVKFAVFCTCLLAGPVATMIAISLTAGYSLVVYAILILFLYKFLTMDCQMSEKQEDAIRNLKKIGELVEEYEDLSKSSPVSSIEDPLQAEEQDDDEKSIHKQAP